MVAAESTGLLPAKWGGKARQLEEYSGPFATDGVPTVMALVTKETVVSGLDDGAFSNVWLRDQAGNLNYTLGSEYSGTTYPALGTKQNYRVTPLWYESGDGGITRGITEFARRFLVSGSRRFLKVSGWWYFPSLKGTPSRWDGGKATTTAATHVIPSGPLPPTHAGVLERGNIVALGDTVANTFHPDGDIAAGTWRRETGSAVNLFASINEEPASDLTYIQTAANEVSQSEMTLQNPSFVPAVDSTVTINWRGRRASGGAMGGHLTVELVQGATVRASTFNFMTPTVSAYSYTLTAAQIAAITAGAGGWGDLRLRFTTTGATGGYYAQVTYATLGYVPNASIAEGAWLGKKRFLHAMAYRSEDGSVWMPSTPRLPSSDQPGGFNMFTVDAANPEAQYDFVRWTHLPLAPKGCTRILLRTLSVDSTVAGDELKLNPYDLRVVWELTDNSTTEYIDYQADDLGLAEDSAGAFIRYDHLMPPRARYIAGGDMRIVHAYGGRNPCAIEIAPVGRLADYDLNLAEDDPALYTSRGSYMRVRYSAGVDAYLDLMQSNGAVAAATLQINLTVYDTLQKLVDRINATSVARDGQQWRAQLCPGANPAAPSATCLTPHYRILVASCSSTAGSPILTAASGMAKVAVGNNATSLRLAAGSYVLRIDSDMQATLSANAVSTGTDSPVFYANTGDVGETGSVGYQRVIANALPGFLYFNASYLNEDPIDKSAVWMTVATPGSFKSAANSFSGKIANRFKPPTHAGKAMGGGAVDQGFVLPFEGGNFALRNTRDTSSGIDEDYKLIELNPHRGCIAWNTVAPGPRFVVFLTAEGWVAADLDREVLISEAIYQHDRIPIGSMAWEIDQCVAATGQDNDGAYASAKILRSCLRVNYRSGALAAAHPDLEVDLDFSSGHISSGLEALYRAPGELWGWSTRLRRAFSVLCEGRRADRAHLYGWNDMNLGSTGDGRIDEFEVGDTDNGVEIAAELRGNWARAGRAETISGQEIVIEHDAPVGAAVFLDFHRSFLNDVYPLTLATTTLDVLPEVKQLPQKARATSRACSVGYRQTAGPAAELRLWTLRIKRAKAYR